MNTIIIQLINQKAYVLLEDMQKLNLIGILKGPTKISGLRGQLKTSMGNDQIDEQINAIRKEWERDFSQ